MKIWDVIKPSILVAFLLAPVLSSGTTYRVDMFNFSFDAESLTVNQGDTVLWSRCPRFSYSNERCKWCS